MNQEKDFGQLFYEKFIGNVQQKVSFERQNGQAPATFISAVVQGTTILASVAMQKSSKAIELIDFARNVETLAIGHATDKNVTYNEFAGSLVGLAVGMGVTALGTTLGVTAAPAIVAVGVLSFVVGIVADAAATALLDVAKEQGYVAEFILDLSDGFSRFKDVARENYDAILAEFYDISESTADIISDAVSDFGADAYTLITESIPEWIDDVASTYSEAIQRQLRRLIDPLVLDLDGDGISLIGREAANVYFNMDDDSAKELTGWVNGKDAFLAFDENGNNLIDGLSELFGDANMTGFEELAMFDSNSDGLIDQEDNIWSSLQLWIDSDVDAVTDEGELVGLGAFGIKSIDLNFVRVNFVAQGNQIHEQSIFEYQDGRTGSVADIWFDVSSFLTDSSVSLSGIALIDALPDIRGKGEVSSLRLSMIADADLTATVAEISNLSLGDLGRAKDLVEEALFRWAGVFSVDADSRGGIFDARKLGALEAFLGIEFAPLGNSNPDIRSLSNLNEAWSSLFDSVATRLLLEGSLKPVFGDFARYVAQIDRVFASGSLDDLVSSVRVNLPNGDASTVGGYLVEAIRVLRVVVQENNLDPTGNELSSMLSELLRPTGLEPLSDLLKDGILSISDQSLVINNNGIFSLSDLDNEVVLVSGRQVIYAGDGNDSVFVENGSNSSKFIAGEAGTDAISGGGGSDWLDGGLGADTMSGGGGNDTYTVDNAGDLVMELSGFGVDEVRSDITYTLTDDVENLTLLGTAAISGAGNLLNNVLTGNAGANRLEGFEGDDVLDGGEGDDILIGGLGRDTYTVNTVGDRITETGGDFDTVRSFVNYTLGTRLEGLVLLGTALNGTGNSANNNLAGNELNNLLNGGLGVDTMSGGLGDDIYVIDNRSDVVSESTNGGLDTARSSVSYVLGNNVENLILTTDEDINGTGNALVNVLTGNAGDNVLDGGAGADVLDGRLGDDTYVIDNVGDVVREQLNSGTDSVRTNLSNYNLQDNLENLQLFISSSDSAARNGTGNTLNNQLLGNQGVNVLSGLAGNDRLFGSGGNDSLSGDAGNDSLDGGIGDDRMDGGAGDDVYVVGEIGDIVIESVGAGTDRVQSSISFVLDANLENLTLTGTAAVDGQGNNLNNVLTGNNSSNKLDGGLGADTMSGGGGNDTYTVDNAGDRIIEFPSGGIDEIRSSVNIRLAPGVENLVLLGTADLLGIGNALNNRLFGNAGNNTLTGGIGSDTLQGGGGADIFVYNTTSEAGGLSSNIESILDFSSSEGDLIDLSSIDSVTSTLANDEFVFVGSSAFTGAGQVRVLVNQAVTRILINTDEDLTTAEAVIGLIGSLAMSEADFIL